MKIAQTLPVAALLASSAAATGWFPACAVRVTLFSPRDLEANEHD
jgi:hypothetical protein